MRVIFTKKRDDVSPQIANIIRALSQGGRTQVLMAAGQEFLRETKANIGASTGPYRDKPWAAISKSYAKRVGRSYATLQVTGELRNSIKLGSVRNNAIEIYTRDPKAAALAFGYKLHNLPARNYWPMQNQGSPNYHRLTFNAERDMFKVITKRLTTLSNGALPYQSQITNRAPLEYSSPFTSL